jgi:hypothetical protein
VMHRCLFLHRRLAAPVGCSRRLYGRSNTASSETETWPTTRMRGSPQAGARRRRPQVRRCSRFHRSLIALHTNACAQRRAPKHAQTRRELPLPFAAAPNSTGAVIRQPGRNSRLRAFGVSVRTTPSTKKENELAPSV